ncbi:MAG: MFS transporter [Elainellaceae cyanobacterium]
MLYWVQPGDLWFGGLVFVIAQVGYILAAGLYDAFLPVLVPPSQVERLSSLGWGLGYIGGLVCFFMSYGWLKGGLEPANLATYQLTFLLVAGFYLAIALPAIAWLPRQTPDSRDRRPERLIAQAYQKVLHTVFHWRDLSTAFRFLAGYYLISDGVVTVGSFIAIYLTTVFGMSTAQILQLTLLFNMIAIPATVGVGLLSHRWSAQTLLAGIIAIWVGLLLFMALGTQPWIPIVIIVLLGLVTGSTQSICRGFYAQIIPVNQASELFGFHSLVSKVSAVLGPLTYGFISAVTDNQRLAIASLMFFFLAGGWIVSTVPLAEETTE